jgi:methionyl-tRNA formyltransferase
MNETPIKILRASLHSDQIAEGEPGTVISIDKVSMLVACGQGVLSLEVLQKPGGKALPVGQFIQGFSIKVGDRLGAI